MVFLFPIYLVTPWMDAIERPCSLWSCKGTTTRSPMQKLFLLPLTLGSILCGYICKYLTTPFIRPLMYSFMYWEYSGLRILYLIGYNRWLSLLLMLNLFPSWPLGTTWRQLLCPVHIFPSFPEHFHTFWQKMLQAPIVHPLSKLKLAFFSPRGSFFCYLS